MEDTTDTEESVETADVGADLADNAGEQVGTDAGDGASDFQAVTDAQVVSATEALGQMEALRPEVWEGLGVEERLEALQGIEDRMAEIQGRPAVAVGTATLEEGTYGGYRSDYGIVLNEAHVASNDIAEIVDSVVHEGRHAYQDYAIHHLGFVSDASLVESWTANWDNPLSAQDYGQEAYMAQPIEADAWAYAGRIRQALYGREQL